MRVALATLGLLVLWVAPAAAQQDTWGYKIAHELMSPFCPGRTLSACPSAKADELRVWILMQEAAGASREEVEAELVERYGERILPAPPAEDVSGIVGYVVPILAIVAGAPLLWWLLRRLTATTGESAPTAEVGPLDPALAAEVDRELRELDA